jgi:glycosyltransferase involved in cell wall biosynthesis
LLIIADGQDVRDLVPQDDPSIRLIHLAGRSEIGDKRNLGCQHARGEIIAHWDDDDTSAPERLADQIARMQQSGKAVTAYHTMRFLDGADWWLCRCWSLYAIGTSLCYRREFWKAHPFPSLQIGEDNAFGDAARRAHELVCCDAGEMMFARIHPGNTSRKNTADGWTRL